MHQTPEEIMNDRQARYERALQALQHNGEHVLTDEEAHYEALVRAGLEAFASNTDPTLSDRRLAALTTTAVNNSTSLRYRENPYNRRVLFEAAYQAHLLLQRRPESQ